MSYKNYKQEGPSTYMGLYYEQDLERRKHREKINKEMAEYESYQFETIVEILRDFNENLRKLAEKKPTTVFNIFTCAEDPTEFVEKLKTMVE